MSAVSLMAIASFGCGGDDDDQSKAAQADSDESTTSTSDTTTTTVEPTTTTAALPAAADGSDVAACFDGACEVLVTPSVAFDFDPALRFSSATIDVVGPQGVDITFATADGSVWEFRQQLPGGTSTMNSTAVEILGISGDQAVVRFSPAG